MSELKRCPFCGIGMETTNGQHYFHPDNDCILHGFGIDIGNRRSVKSWNTRKPMERIVERLKEEAFPDFEEEYTCNGEELLYLSDAIGIVRECNG